jgi:hypothetical protein
LNCFPSRIAALDCAPGVDVPALRPAGDVMVVLVLLNM